MLHWSEYKPHTYIKYKNSEYDKNIYTLDTETTSCVLHNHEVYPSSSYEDIDVDDDTRVYAFVYIWMVSVNEIVYYGRHLEELPIFLEKVFYSHSSSKFICWVHNLPFDFDFIRSVLDFTEGKTKLNFAREKLKPITMQNKNVTFRCTYSLTGESLEEVSKMYSLPVAKKAGDLDYELLRTPDTPLTEKELEYCEYDCLVIYHLIRHFLEMKDEDGNILYPKQKDIPKTKTSITRNKLKRLMADKDDFIKACARISTEDVYLYDFMKSAFAGGYTHANCFNAERVHENVKSFDFNSSYPYVMATEPYFPQKEFVRCNVNTEEDLRDDYVYFIKIKMKNVKSKKENRIISFSQCKECEGYSLDNGRIRFADNIVIICTSIDLKLFRLFYDFDLTFIEVYGSPRGYLPKSFISFILELYKSKTELKDVEGMERLYMSKKVDLNALYGMSVTDNIRGDVYYDDEGWHEDILTFDIKRDKLHRQMTVFKTIKDGVAKYKPFLPFAYGPFITALARFNLLSIVSELDSSVIYCDTDSAKLCEGFDEDVIKRYNENVLKKIKKAEETLGVTGYTSYDKNGNPHTLGIFEEEHKNFGKEFITLGAKKYCYIGNDEKIHITVAGVPKKRGANALATIEDFHNDFIFKGSVTGKRMHVYSKEKDVNLTVTDYLGNSSDVRFSYGIGLVPCSYKLQRSVDITEILNYDKHF